MYKVISWDTGEVLSEHSELKKARMACRMHGTIPIKDWENKYLKTLPPVARVQDEAGFCVYNPRFKNPGYTGE